MVHWAFPPITKQNAARTCTAKWESQETITRAKPRTIKMAPKEVRNGCVAMAIKCDLKKNEKLG